VFGRTEKENIYSFRTGLKTEYLNTGRADQWFGHNHDMAIDNNSDRVNKTDQTGGSRGDNTSAER
jgi:hypothetical protein